MSTTASEDFETLTGPFRRELLAHCYRMLGSADEAEDLVQETYLRAWRAFDSFEGRSSVRTWLYRIATNACLTALERRSRRPLPSGLGPASEDPLTTTLDSSPEIPWLQPLPDALLANPDDPADVAVSRFATRLAMTAALQRLSARHRAMLILRDVLGWPAADVAGLLDTTTTAVNSGLRRAREQIAATLPREEDISIPNDPALLATLDRFAAAFEDADEKLLATLLRDDVTLEMPPVRAWFAGRDAVLRFFTAQLLSDRGQVRMTRTAANGQPAFGVYVRDADGAFVPHGLAVLSVTPSGISRIVTFLGAATPGLPAGLPK